MDSGKSIMAQARPQHPALRFAAVFGQDVAALDWACTRAAGEWGAVVQQSADIEFDMTRYYTASMGEGLKKRLVAFETLIDPVLLVESKTRSNEWEAEYQAIYSGPVQRAINIDPGYLTEAKVVLATMKDRDHRLYLGKGVFAEVTLIYQLPGQWISSRWTYPDYCRADYHEFFFACRDYLRRCLQERVGTD